jgi:enoyl-CoA hydratase/carnithine racemase
MSSDDVLLVERQGHVVKLTMNRPENLNAMTREMVAGFHATLDELEAQFPEVRAIVLTGNGRGFCSGTDVRALSANVENGPKPPAERLPPGQRERNIGDLGARLYHMPQPVIAAVNGTAVGAGFALVTASDIRIAAKPARFAGIFINRSLPPDGGSSYTLAQLVGPAVAAEVLYTGRIYDSDWALRVGLVSSVVEPDQLLPDAMAIAEEIASKPPIAMRHTKELLHEFGPNLADVVEREMDVVGVLGATEDQVEAIKSFMEKREPVFVGR